MVTTRGFLTSQVTTHWVLVTTSDFPEVPLPAGKNPCLSLFILIPSNMEYRDDVESDSVPAGVLDSYGIGG